MNELECYITFKDTESFSKNEVVDIVYHYISKLIKLPKWEEVVIAFSGRLQTTGGWTVPAEKRIHLSDKILDTPTKIYTVLASAII